VAARTPPEPPDVNRLGVFVTGLIGAGALLSVLVGIGESIGGARHRHRTQRRAVPAAANLAELVVAGTPTTTGTPTGLRSRRWYAAMALVIAAVAAATAAATVRHGRDVWGDDDELGTGVLWIAVALLSAGPLLVTSALVAGASLQWPHVHPLVRRHLAADAGRRTASIREMMPRRHRRAIATLTAVVAVLLGLVVLAEPWLLRVDRRVYEAIDANQHARLWGPEWFGMYFGRPQVVVPAALLVALFTLRCRVLALAYPLTIVFGGLLNMGLGALVGRQRPPLSEHAAQTDSFPSGHAIEVTLLLGLAPLAVAVLLRSRWVGVAVRALASVVLVVMLADGVRDGSHWVSDHIAGFSIAMVAVVFVHALARMPALHERCRDCPALELTRRRDLDVSRPERGGAP
jgi:membrane-associated phospholipid phosphatase